MHTINDIQPPRSAQELDILMRRIDLGEDTFAALSDEQREQATRILADRWITEYLDDYPVPVDIKAAALEYRAIESGSKYPHLPARVRRDLLIQFDDQHAEGGGPDHWTGNV